MIMSRNIVDFYKNRIMHTQKQPSVASSHPKQNLRSTKNRYKKKKSEHSSDFGDPSESRTPDTMIKSHVLYLLS